MNTETQTTRVSQAVTDSDEFEKLLSRPLNDAARRVDEIASRAEHLFAHGSFAAELAIANTIAELRGVLTPEVMKPIMALMNTPLGFMTDKNPNVRQSDGFPTPYAIDVVRECFIEAVMRGFRAVGNEWNIIASRFYGCQNGFNRKTRSYPGVSEFKETYEVPRFNSDQSGAIVKCRASWKLNGVADVVERELPIKVNKFMGSDAILGKAKRKLLKAAHDQMTGTNTPEGDVTDSDAPVIAATEATKPTFARPEPKTNGSAKVEQPATVAEIPSASAPSESSPPASEQSASAPGATAERETLSGMLENVPFDDFRGWLISTGHYPEADSISGMHELPLEIVKKLLLEPKSLAKCVKLYGGKEAK